MTEYRCQIRDCQRPGTVLINFGEIPVMGAALCSRHKPTGG